MSEIPYEENESKDELPTFFSRASFSVMRSSRSHSIASGWKEARKAMQQDKVAEEASKSAPRLPSENTRDVEEESIDEPSAIPNSSSRPQVKFRPRKRIPSITESVHIQQILSDELPAPLNYESFLAFCTTSYCAENVRFWKEIKQYQESRFHDHALYAQESERLINTYISSKADAELNLPNEIKASIQSKTKLAMENLEMNTTIFDEALVHITRLMDNDSLPRFKKMLLV